MRLRLVMTNGTKSHWAELSGAEEFSLGREGADLELEDPRCSRLHAALYAGPGGQLEIRDLKSRNGTIVNGAKVQQAVLPPKAVIRLGRTCLMIIDYEISKEASEGKAQVRLTEIVDDSTPSKKKIPAKPHEKVQGIPVVFELDDAPPISSDLLCGWPANFQALEKTDLKNFISHLDDDQVRGSRRLLDILGKKSRG